MASFPKITSPCLYKGLLSDILDQDAVCGLCHRQVHDLSAMSERRRIAFLKACSGETCVTYRLPAAAALALATLAIAAPVAAQEAPPADAEVVEIQGSYDVNDLIITGGIGTRVIQDVAIPIEVMTLESLARFGDQTQADAAKRRWNETHRRLDSGKARRDDEG